jgi:transposase
VNVDGLPIGIVLTPGEAHDLTAYPGLMEERDSDPGILLADKGYDSDTIRKDANDRGATPEIPTTRNRKVQHCVDKPVNAVRSRVEHCIGHLKEMRRIATRFDKTATSFLGFTLLGCLRKWIGFVHSAYSRLQQADGGRGRWHDVYHQYRSPTARTAEGSAAAQHGQRLLSALGLPLHSQSHPLCTLRAML